MCYMHLSLGCVAAAEGVKIAVMEDTNGGVETDLKVTFSCDSLKLAAITLSHARHVALADCADPASTT